MKIGLFFILLSVTAQGRTGLKDLALKYEKLQRMCEQEKEPNLYADKATKQLAITNFKAQAQHFALKNIINFVSDAAKNLSIPKPQFESTVGSLIQDQCSQNMSLISRESLKELLIERFDKTTHEADYSEPDYIEGLTLLSDFCSWHGRGHLNSMITYYLKDPLFAEVVIENYLSTSIPVYCTDRQCRLTNRNNFRGNYERSKNKVDFEDELKALYCFEIKNSRYELENEPDQYTEKRLKESSETLQKTKLYLYATLENRPAPRALDNWAENSTYFFSQVLNSEVQSSLDVLELMTNRVEMEENLELRARVFRDIEKPSDLRLNFDITGDEFDRLVYNIDKMTWSFDYEISNDEIYRLLNRIDEIYYMQFEQRQLAFENLSKEFAARISKTIWKEKLSKIPSLNYIPNLPYQLSKGLIENLKSYRGSKEHFMGEKGSLSIPLSFSFGWQALRRLSQLRKLDIK